MVVHVSDQSWCLPKYCPLPCPTVNHPPIVGAGEDVVLNERASIRLTCFAFDPDGDQLTYQWTAACGRGHFDNPYILHPIYTAPALDCKETKDITLMLTVTDSHGASTSDSMVVHVKKICPLSCAPVCVPICPPVCLAPCPPVYTVPCTPVCPLPCQVPVCTSVSPTKSVNEGESIQLYGKVSDPDSNLASYYWNADKGTFNDSSSLDPIYTAPMTGCCEGEDACITLTAMDSCCATGVDQLVLRINNVNHPPVADAGEDLIVTSCSSVQLTCSAYDPDGDRLSYQWTAECGRGAFSDSHVLHPLYTAPPAKDCTGEDVVLTLTVTDACGASSSDSMVVHVRKGNSPPTVKADP